MEQAVDIDAVGSHFGAALGKMLCRVHDHSPLLLNGVLVGLPSSFVMQERSAGSPSQAFYESLRPLVATQDRPANSKSGSPGSSNRTQSDNYLPARIAPSKQSVYAVHVHQAC